MSINSEAKSAQLLHEDSAVSNVDDIENEHLAAKIAEINDQHRSKWQTMKEFPFACFCVLIMVWTLILASFESQAGGIVVSIVQFRRHFGHLVAGGDPDNSSDYVLETTWQSVLSGVPLAAQIVGQSGAPYLNSRFGKKWVMYAFNLASFAFIGMEFAAKKMKVFVAGKTLNGLCIGVIQQLCVSYVSEIAPLQLRGVSTALCNISFSIGPMVCFIINYSLTGKGPNDAWAYRAVFASQWGFATTNVILLLLIPESPTYHILKGSFEEAERCYRQLLRNEVAAKEQYNVVKVTVEEAENISQGTSYLDLFKGVNLKRTMVSIMPFSISPNSGVAFTASYTTYWFQLTGYSDSVSFKYTCVAQTISILGCIASLFIVDLGRRRYYMIGLASVIVTNFIIGGTGMVKDNQAVMRTTVAFMMLYGGIYNAGIGSVGYSICSENPTSALRAKTIALGLATTNVWGMFWSFVLPYVFNPDRGNLGAKTMFIFGGVSFLFLVYLFFCQTETAKRSYDEIDELYASGISLRKFEGYVTRNRALDQELVMGEEKMVTQHAEDASEAV